jgi:hypothetical protein
VALWFDDLSCCQVLINREANYCGVDVDATESVYRTDDVEGLLSPSQFGTFTQASLLRGVRVYRQCARLFFLFLPHVSSLWAQPCPVTWDPTLQISNTQSSAFAPNIAVVGNTVHVVYLAGAVYYRRSTDGGESWGQQVELVPDDSMS